MARTYRRDPRGRFSSTGGSGAGRKLAARMVSRGKNRLTRDNAGRITSVGGQGATARGGRLRTAAGNKRATQLAKLKGTGSRLRKPMGGGGRISRAEPLMTGGTLAARSSLKRARQKLAGNPSPAQRGAVTRANRYAAAARFRDTSAKAIKRPASVMRKRRPELPMTWTTGKGGGVKKVGWMQSPDARKMRVANAASRSAMAGRLASLPKAARRSIYKKADPVEQSQRRNRAGALDRYQQRMTAKASAKRAREQQKPKRLAFARVYHGTSREAAKSIRSAGYKETPRGLYGPGVYSTTSKKVAREYARWRAAGSPDMTTRFGRLQASKPGGVVLAHRVSKSKLVRDMDRMDGATRRRVVTSGKAATVGAAMTGKPGKFAIMGASLANKTLIKQSGIVSAPRSKATRRRSVRVRRR